MEVYRVLFENSPDGIVVTRDDGRIADANQQACRMFRWEREELVGQSVEVLVPTDARKTHEGHRRRFHQSAAGPRPMGIGLELRGRRKDGTEFPVEISLSPLEGGLALATVRDVTLRRRLRDFSVGALRATEDVRAAIARDLHDETAQELAALMIHLRLLERATSEEERAERIEVLRDGLEHAANGVRRIARGLRPPELQDAGLGPALEAHVRRLDDDGRLSVSLDAEEVDARLKPDSALILYRVVQEALTNVARHAGVAEATVRVFERDDAVVAEIVDRGRGFDVDADRLEEGRLGLMGMHERASMVGGRLHIDSRPGEGTRVRLTLPADFDREVNRV